MTVDLRSGGIGHRKTLNGEVKGLWADGCYLSNFKSCLEGCPFHYELPTGEEIGECQYKGDLVSGKRAAGGISKERAIAKWEKELQNILTSMVVCVIG